MILFEGTFARYKVDMKKDALFRGEFEVRTPRHHHHLHRPPFHHHHHHIDLDHHHNYLIIRWSKSCAASFPTVTPLRESATRWHLWWGWSMIIVIIIIMIQYPAGDWQERPSKDGRHWDQAAEGKHRRVEALLWDHGWCSSGQDYENPWKMRPFNYSHNFHHHLAPGVPQVEDHGQHPQVLLPHRLHRLHEVQPCHLHLLSRWSRWLLMTKMTITGKPPNWRETQQPRKQRRMLWLVARWNLFLLWKRQIQTQRQIHKQRQNIGGSKQPHPFTSIQKSL